MEEDGDEREDSDGGGVAKKRKVLRVQIVLSVR